MGREEGRKKGMILSAQGGFPSHPKTTGITPNLFVYYTVFSITSIPTDTNPITIKGAPATPTVPLRVLLL